MARKSVGSFILTALISTPLCSFAAQYPLTVTDLDGRAITLQHEPQRIILQDGRDIMAMALLDRDNPFRRVVAWNNPPENRTSIPENAAGEVAAIRSDPRYGL